jgi:hypothetical protein
MLPVGETDELEKTCPTATLTTIDRSVIGLGSNKCATTWPCENCSSWCWGSLS